MYAYKCTIFIFKFSDTYGLVMAAFCCRNM